MQDSYAQPTENIPGATEAPSPDASVDPLPVPMPVLSGARCAASTNEWVPDHEADTVPAAMADLCLTCPVREQCLVWACVTQQAGYWAATTTRARRNALAEDDILNLIDNPTVAARSTMHPVGAGTIYTYRRGCGCDECRAANAAKKLQERRRAQIRRTLAAAAPSAA